MDEPPPLLIPVMSHHHCVIYLKFIGDDPFTNFKAFQKRLQDIVMLKNIPYYPGENCFSRGFGLCMATSDFARVCIQYSNR
jgi:hypothetical protein